MKLSITRQLIIPLQIIYDDLVVIPLISSVFYFFTFLGGGSPIHIQVMECKMRCHMSYIYKAHPIQSMEPLRIGFHIDGETKDMLRFVLHN